MAPHSSTLAWKIPWTEELGRLQSMGSLRVGHILRGTRRISLRSPAQVEGSQVFLSRPEKDLESPSSTRLEAGFPYHDSRAMTRSPSPGAWTPDFPGAT